MVMTNFQKILNIHPYSLKKKEKNKIFNHEIIYLTKLHIQKCGLYLKILKNLKLKISLLKNYKDFPFLPVKIFKDFELKSVNNSQIYKILRSSGTTSNKTSKIFLDKLNASNQSKVLTKIVSSVLGQKRLPMLIIDKNPVLENRKMFNASIAAINGFSVFGKNHSYLLKNKNSEIDYVLLNNFLKNYGREKFLIFGFTYKIFDNLIKKLNTKKILSNFKNGILLHGGGWKKLEKIKIDNRSFKKKLNQKLKIDNVYNYYGLVEQTGSIFVESKRCGYFHTSNFSDLIIRDKNFNELSNKKRGLIQLISLLPTSYPGHNILTEDEGEIIGEDDCKCGKPGKYFIVHGRTKQAEVRGCSDT